MRNRTELAVVVLALACTWQSAALAGAWSQARGHYYTKVSGIFYTSDEVYNDMGVRQTLGMDNDQFNGSQAFLYAEYGLRERLTLIGQMNVGELVSENNLVRQTTTGIGDADIGVKYQLLDGPVVLSPYATLKIPTGYHEFYEPPLGTGDMDLEFRLLVARSLYPLPLYLGAESGYRWRGGLFSNQVPYFFEIGATPHAKVFAKVYVEGKNTLTGNEESTGEVGSLQVSEGDFTKGGLNAAYNLWGPVWIDLLVERIFDGVNVGAGSSWGIGLSYSN